ncbi:MAG TPA: hypothetical protein VHG72_16400 [Polyangia bacterium]|nr:hypothetical protein [Polyangia bacterium]
MRVGLCGAAMLVAAACGSGGKSQGGGGSGGSSASGHDAAGDAHTDQVRRADSGGACGQSVASACAVALPGDGGFALHCAMSWSEAARNGYFCSRPQTTVLTTTCGDLRELIDANVSVEYVYYYDASGALVAIMYNPGDGSSTCVAGSAGFTVPATCDTLQIFSCGAG